MTPVTNTPSLISNEITTEEMPSKTFKIDFERNRIVEKIDGLEALKQAVFFILNTERFRHIIYSYNYGNEIEKTIGLSFDLARSEVERFINEAILADDRFEEIKDFTVEKTDRNTMIVNFNVVTNIGRTINVEQEVGA